jgi:hypothetical protein
MNPSSIKAFKLRPVFTGGADGAIMISTHPLAAENPRPPTLRNRKL